MQGEVDGQAQLAREATALLNSVLSWWRGPRQGLDRDVGTGMSEEGPCLPDAFRGALEDTRACRGRQEGCGPGSMGRCVGFPPGGECQPGAVPAGNCQVRLSPCPCRCLFIRIVRVGSCGCTGRWAQAGECGHPQGVRSSAGDPAVPALSAVFLLPCHRRRASMPVLFHAALLPLSLPAVNPPSCSAPAGWSRPISIVEKLGPSSKGVNSCHHLTGYPPTLFDLIFFLEYTQFEKKKSRHYISVAPGTTLCGKHRFAVCYFFIAQFK